MSDHITFNQLKFSFDKYKNRVKELSSDDINILWFDDYYDGVLSGLLEYENQKFKFEIITDYTQNIYPRVFAVIQLTAEQILKEIYWNKLFTTHVVDGSKVRPASEHHLFYDKYQNANSDYASNYVRGWFVEVNKS